MSCSIIGQCAHEGVDEHVIQIGERHQAPITDYIPPRARKNLPLNEELEGRAMWQPHRLSSSADVDGYLRFVANLFGESEQLITKRMTQDKAWLDLTPAQQSAMLDALSRGLDLFCPERALFFLHQCDYNIELAMRLLRPSNGAEDDSGGPLALAASSSSSASASSSSASSASASAAKEEGFEGDDYCFVCRDGGELMCCDSCKKVYHPACLCLEKVPKGSWECPHHFCGVCRVRVEDPYRMCALCPTSFCPQHIPPEIQVKTEALQLLEFLCPQCIAKEECVGKGKQTGRRSLMRRLHHVLKRENRPLTSVPQIGGRELDLCILYREVVRQGGINKVVFHTGWSSIKKTLAIGHNIPHASFLLKKHYVNILYPYERQHFAGSCPVDAKAVGVDSDDLPLTASISNASRRRRAVDTETPTPTRAKSRQRMAKTHAATTANATASPKKTPSKTTTAASSSVSSRSGITRSSRRRLQASPSPSPPLSSPSSSPSPSPSPSPSSSPSPSPSPSPAPMEEKEEEETKQHAKSSGEELKSSTILFAEDSKTPTEADTLAMDVDAAISTEHKLSPSPSSSSSSSRGRKRARDNDEADEQETKQPPSTNSASTEDTAALNANDLHIRSEAQLQPSESEGNKTETSTDSTPSTAAIDPPNNAPAPDPSS